MYGVIIYFWPSTRMMRTIQNFKGETDRISPAKNAENGVIIDFQNRHKK